LELVEKQLLLLETASLLQVSQQILSLISPLCPHHFWFKTLSDLSPVSQHLSCKIEAKAVDKCCPRRKNENKTRKPKSVYADFYQDFERLVWILHFY